MTSRWLRISCFVLLIAVVTACTGNGSVDEVTSPTLGPSALDSSTTSEGTTTTAEPTTTTLSEMQLLKAELLALHEEYARGSNAIDTDVPGMWEFRISWFEENSIDPLRAQVVERTIAVRDEGLRLEGPGNIYEIMEIDWRGSSSAAEVAESGVSVTHCRIDLLAGFYPDGTVQTPRADVFVPFQVDYVFDSDKERFFVETTTGFPDRVCDPVDYLAEDGMISSEADRDAVLTVHDEMYSVLLGGIDQRVEGYESTRAVIEQITTDVARERLLRVFDRWEAEGLVADGGGYESNVVAIKVEGDRAAVVDCARYALTLYNADGTVNTPPDDYFELREEFYVRKDGQWLVEYHWEGGDQECKP